MVLTQVFLHKHGHTLTYVFFAYLLVLFQKEHVKKTVVNHALHTGPAHVCMTHRGNLFTM